MNTAELKVLIQKNAAEVSRLHARIHETLRFRGNGTRGRSEWQSACAEFHARYNELAFPGGYEGAATRILAAEPLAVEAALCFLELRPYFFRSGYMYQEILRKVKRAPLRPEQSERLSQVLVRQAAWKARRAQHNAT
jgi:hypothetical protein